MFRNFLKLLCFKKKEKEKKKKIFDYFPNLELLEYFENTFCSQKISSLKASGNYKHIMFVIPRWYLAYI